ncbi:MAG: hypothetical protein WAV10_01710 [Minisyncoccia bacterium]
MSFFSRKKNKEEIDLTNPDLVKEFFKNKSGKKIVTSREELALKKEKTEKIIKPIIQESLESETADALLAEKNKTNEKQEIEEKVSPVSLQQHEDTENEIIESQTEEKLESAEKSKRKRLTAIKEIIPIEEIKEKEDYLSGKGYKNYINKKNDKNVRETNELVANAFQKIEKREAIKKEKNDLKEKLTKTIKEGKSNKEIQALEKEYYKKFGKEEMKEEERKRIMEQNNSLSPEEILEKMEEIYDREEIENIINEPPKKGLEEFETNLVQARKKYAIEYKQFLKDRRKNADVLLRAARWITGSKVHESEIPEELKKLEENYDKVAIEYGQKMYADKKLELENSKMSEDEQKAELARYKSNEIFTKVIIEEQSRLNELKAENLPPKEKGRIGKALAWWIDPKTPRWKKIAISTAVSTLAFAVFSPGTVAAAGGTGAFIAYRAGRGVLGSIFGQTTSQTFDFSTKLYNWAFNKKTSSEKREEDEEKLQKLFAEESFDTNFIKNKKEYADILEREKKAKKDRLITKAIITMAAGGLASYGMGDIFHGTSHEQVLSADTGTHHVSTGHEIPNTKTEINNFPKHDGNYDEAVKKGFHHEEVNTNDNINKTETPNTTENIFKGEKIQISSKGAIQTIEDLKNKIHTDYPDISKAPASVQEFMKTNSTEEAIKLGMYNPNSPAESMNVLKGSTISFDEHGNLSYHDIKTGEDHVLIGEQGDVEKYHGQMLDSDKGVTHTTGIGENQNHLNNDLVQNQTEPTAIKAESPLENQTEPTSIKAESPLNNQNQTNIQSEKPNTIETNGNQNEISNNLSPEMLKEVNQTYEENINHLFGDKTAFMQDNVLNSENLTADKMIHLNTEGMTDETKKLVSYLNKLKEVTGLNPIEKNLAGLIPAETNTQYINRALLEAARNGKLEEVKL